MRTIKKIIVHCSDSDFGDAETIRRWHTDPKPKGNGWLDIGYHFVILNGVREHGQEYDPALDGFFELGRDIELPGAHCKWHNADSIGVCLIGRRHFTGKQLYHTLPWLLAALMDQYKIPITEVYGHHDFDPSKECPCIATEQIRNAVRAMDSQEAPSPERMVNHGI